MNSVMSLKTPYQRQRPESSLNIYWIYLKTLIIVTLIWKQHKEMFTKLFI